MSAGNTKQIDNSFMEAHTTAASQYCDKNTCKYYHMMPFAAAYAPNDPYQMRIVYCTR